MKRITVRLDGLVARKTVRGNVPVAFLKYVFYTDRGIFLGPRIRSRHENSLVTDVWVATFDFKIKGVRCMDVLNNQLIKPISFIGTTIVKGENVQFGYYFNFADGVKS